MTNEGLPVSNALVLISGINNESYNETVFSNDSGLVDINTPLPAKIKVIANKFQKKTDTITQNLQAVTLNANFTNITKLILTGQASEIAAENTSERVKVVGKAKIRELAAVNLSEALANEINITINQDAQLGAGVSLRGIAGQQVKFLMDGVPIIGRNDGVVDLSQINTGNIERIEIIEGPMSIIYGTDAAGGVINVISAQPKKNETKLSFNQFAASNGTFNSFVSFSKGSRKNQFNINATRMIFQGFDEDTEKRNPLWRPKRQLATEAFYQHYFNKNIKQNFRVSYFNELLQSKGAPNVTAISANALDDYFTTQRANFVSQTQVRLLKFKTRLNLTNAMNFYLRNRERMVTNLETLEQQASATADGQDTQTFQSFNSRLIGLSALNKYFNLGYGFDINLEQGNSQRIRENEGINDYALFYNLKFKYKKWMVEQGLRATYNSKFAVPIIPALHAKYTINKNWVSRISYASGFRTPSIKERYLYFVDQNHDVVGNPNLQPESSNSITAGITHQLESKQHDVFVDLSLFRTDIQDMIVLASTNSNGTSFRYENIESFQSQGANLRLSYGRNNFEMNTGIGYIGIRQTTDSLINQDAFLYRMDAQLNLSYTVSIIKTKFSILNKYNGSVPNYFKENNTLKLQYSTPFMLTDLSAIRKFAQKKLTIVINVKNIFNVTSIENVNAIGGVHNPGTNSANVAMGRFYGINLFFDIIK